MPERIMQCMFVERECALRVVMDVRLVSKGDRPMRQSKSYGMLVTKEDSIEDRE